MDGSLLKEHVAKLHDEVTSIQEQNGEYLHKARHSMAEKATHQRRFERLKAIHDELAILKIRTDVLMGRATTS